MRRYSEIVGEKEVTNLVKGMDFRHPLLRREVFKRFFGFHTSYKIQPGLVYLFLPIISSRLNLDIEQRLWFAFLEGCTENPCTAYFVLLNFPTLPKKNDELKKFELFHREVWKKLQYDIDTRYNKGHLVEQTISYVNNLCGRTQLDYFTDCFSNDKKLWFDRIFKRATKVYKYGRMTTWSYLEFVKILSGLDFEYSSFMFKDSASKSHRNGLIKVLGRDELELTKEIPDSLGRIIHNKSLCDDLEKEGDKLLYELRDRYNGVDWYNLIQRETVESTLCTFKNCFRGRRYHNVYTDMSYYRIKKAEQEHRDVDFRIFWDIRSKNLPKELLLENGSCFTENQKKSMFKQTGRLPFIGIYDETFKILN